MKISNSKKQLAKIIHDNGGWREGIYAVQDKDDKKVWFMCALAGRPDGAPFWPGVKSRGFPYSKVLPNWPQTILSRDEYIHLYPALGELCGNVAEENRHEQVWTNPPSIEHLAADYRNAKDYADRKQQEADAAKADAETKLAELVAAGEALGLVLSVAATEPEPEPELVITDWRDLQAGDVISVSGNWWEPDLEYTVDENDGSRDAPISVGGCWVRIGECSFKFIRRPAQGA